ncbi:DUF2267 domain-containing protein [Oxynema aestuarii]|uniref:DUF2267 domain-containing protein n=1 Tax=Oxynema aestuarii AP17 TaxID=2064643 RepID=A0A6H1U3W7_9CYAN|nr:DUF2267 domain-containing protein [Oxynema aestuarii]QIZ73126.1 DUF2267 domain-containing protein [Oxynema aestuarii AP17]RMH75443.1 MAG: DUF2267 domain-containing protein [Cyanobacteria bacterium J007]
MTIAIREDITYILLKKLRDAGEAEGNPQIEFSAADFGSNPVDEKTLLGNLDYLNRNGYIEVEYTGSPQAEQVSKLSAPVNVKAAKITDKGREMLQKMEANPPESLAENSQQRAIGDRQVSFLEKVRVKAALPDIFDARNLSEVVFRTMRDLMPNQTVDKVADQLHTQAVSSDNKALQDEIVDLWMDTNPIVTWIGRIRPPLKIDADLFVRRVAQEGGIPRYTDPETVICAVFAATKDELSRDRVEEISEFLPGRIQQMWQNA